MGGGVTSDYHRTTVGRNLHCGRKKFRPQCKFFSSADENNFVHSAFFDKQGSGKTGTPRWGNGILKNVALHAEPSSFTFPTSTRNVLRLTDFFSTKNPNKNVKSPPRGAK
jgi:hypothetical protein